MRRLRKITRRYTIRPDALWCPLKTAEYKGDAIRADQGRRRVGNR